MLLAQRREHILDALAQGGQTVRDLADSLSVSESTIRRDLRLMEQDGLLERKYGGAILTHGSRMETTDSGDPEAPILSPLNDSSYELRHRLATAAVDMVEDGNTVILDIGSTTPLIARSLKGRRITIITSNLAVFDEVRDDPGVDLVLIGGVVRHNHQTLVGPLAEQATRQVSADIMFLSCTGVRKDVVVDNMAIEAPIKRSLLASAERVVLLASEKKFPGTGGLQLCRLNEVDTVITTSGTPEAITNQCRASGRKVIVV